MIHCPKCEGEIKIRHCINRAKLPESIPKWRGVCEHCSLALGEPYIEYASAVESTLDAIRTYRQRQTAKASDKFIESLVSDLLPPPDINEGRNR